MPEFYKRPLPDSCVAFDSKEGRAHFESALASGGLENFFVPVSYTHLTLPTILLV